MNYDTFSVVVVCIRTGPLVIPMADCIMWEEADMGATCWDGRPGATHLAHTLPPNTSNAFIHSLAA